MSAGHGTARVSVLLPVWNAEDTLSTCLRSIVRQSERDWECVVVDDGSTDRSLDLARSFAKEDPRFRVEPGAHAGLVASLERGLAICSAPIVARLDADDWMHRERLSLQCAALEGDVALDAVGCLPRVFPRREMTDGARRYEAWLHSLVDADLVYRDRFVESPVAHPTLAVRTKALRELGYRDRGWPEDYDLLLRLLRRGPCVGMVPRRLVGWRDLPDRLSRSDERYALDRFAACRAWHLHRDFLAGVSQYILWGYGRTGRTLVRDLDRLGHRPSAIVEVHPRRIGETIQGVPVLAPPALAPLLARAPDQRVVVSVSGAGPRSEIRAALREMGLREGDRFVCAA